jgi:hypothetical protein
MSEAAEHSIDFAQTGVWQEPGGIHWASCECGWQSEKGSESSVEAEVRRHLSEAEPE